MPGQRHVGQVLDDMSRLFRLTRGPTYVALDVRPEGRVYAQMDETESVSELPLSCRGMYRLDGHQLTVFTRRLWWSWHIAIAAKHHVLPDDEPDRYRQVFRTAPLPGYHRAYL